MREVEGCVIVADAMHCQKETAVRIREKQADYLLNAKDNQLRLKRDIEEYVQDDDLKKNMDTFKTCEKNGGRIEVRTGFVVRGKLIPVGRMAARIEKNAVLDILSVTVDDIKKIGRIREMLLSCSAERESTLSRLSGRRIGDNQQYPDSVSITKENQS
jgi:hypothetical protein